MEQFKLYGHTKRNSTVLQFESPAQLRQVIEPLKGRFVLTVTMLENDDESSDKQQYYFRAVIVQAFLIEASKQKQCFTEVDCELFLLAKFGVKGLDLEEYSKNQLSELIDKSQRWLIEFFNSELFSD